MDEFKKGKLIASLVAGTAIGIIVIGVIVVILQAKRSIDPFYMKREISTLKVDIEENQAEIVMWEKRLEKYEKNLTSER